MKSWEAKRVELRDASQAAYEAWKAADEALFLALTWKQYNLVSAAGASYAARYEAVEKVSKGKKLRGLAADADQKRCAWLKAKALYQLHIDSDRVILRLVK